MESELMTEVTRILAAIEGGDQQAAAQLLPLVYGELRRLAAQRLANEQSGQTLQATALVHEAYLRLIGDQQFKSRGHFFAAAAEAMRRILIESARRRKTLKRGMNEQRQVIDPNRIAAPEADDDLIALNDALDQLSARHPEHGELVKLRYFAGLTADEAAAVLGLSPSTADRRWSFARAWLKPAMIGEVPLL
jgi:RNA polymerase sigma factor (TIGR02999 family)